MPGKKLIATLMSASKGSVNELVAARKKSRTQKEKEKEKELKNASAEKKRGSAAAGAGRCLRHWLA